jgi:hypothetical protein
MKKWFLVKVKYTKQLENGTFKRVSEPYLVAADSFSDAEARIYEELGSIIKGEFDVNRMTRVQFHDVFSYEDSDIWFKCKISFATQTEDGYSSKKVSQNFLVSASSVQNASIRLKESLQTLMVDFDINSVVESPIVDIFPFVEKLEEEVVSSKTT